MVLWYGTSFSCHAPGPYAPLTDLSDVCRVAERVGSPSTYPRVVRPAVYVIYDHDGSRVPDRIDPTAASIGLNIALVTASTHSGDVFAVQTGRWITANYAITLATNLSSTSTYYVVYSWTDPSQLSS